MISIFSFSGEIIFNCLKLIGIMKYSLLSLLSIFFALSGISIGQDPLKDFAGGTGTKENPYLIETCKQLSNIRNYVGGQFSGTNFKLNRDIEFKESDFAVGGEFYNNGQGWAPIGVFRQKYFEGNFDGGGKMITGLVSSKRFASGLFGCTKGATIKNLTLQNCRFFSQGEDEFVFTGGIIARMEGGVIDHCCFIGNLSFDSNALNMTWTGGLAGEVIGGEIKCCWVRADIKGKGSEGGVDTGGIAGKIYRTEVKDCYVEVVINSLGGGGVGGIVGAAVFENSGNIITRCYVMGSIYAESHVGGIVGYIDGPYPVVQNFVWLQSLERKKNSNMDYSLGKIVGRMGSSNKLNHNYSLPTMILKGRRDKTQDSLTGIDGMRTRDYEKKEFWDQLGFVFGNTSKSPWFFTKEGRPVLYGFNVPEDTVVIKKGTRDNKSVSENSFDPIKNVYERESAKLKNEAENNRAIFVKELMSNYDALLSKELTRIGDVNLELAAVIQLEQEKLKQVDSYSFFDMGGIPEITKLRKPFGARLTLFEKENEGKLKRARDALDLKYVKALSVLQKKSTLNKDYTQALQIKKEIDRLNKNNSGAQE